MTFREIRLSLERREEGEVTLRRDGLVQPPTDHSRAGRSSDSGNWSTR